MNCPENLVFLLFVFPPTVSIISPCTIAPLPGSASQNRPYLQHDPHCSRCSSRWLSICPCQYFVNPIDREPLPQVPIPPPKKEPEQERGRAGQPAGSSCALFTATTPVRAGCRAIALSGQLQVHRIGKTLILVSFGLRIKFIYSDSVLVGGFALVSTACSTQGN